MVALVQHLGGEGQKLMFFINFRSGWDGPVRMGWGGNM